MGLGSSPLRAVIGIMIVLFAPLAVDPWLARDLSLMLMISFVRNVLRKNSWQIRSNNDHLLKIIIWWDLDRVFLKQQHCLLRTYLLKKIIIYLWILQENKLFFSQIINWFLTKSIIYSTVYLFIFKKYFKQHSKRRWDLDMFFFLATAIWNFAGLWSIFLFV